MDAARDPWGGRTPRAWQADALPAIGAALDAGRRPVVVAATGAGKSLLTAALLAGRTPAVVVVPTQRLVTQTAATLCDLHGAGAVGVYYGRKKQADRPIVVCCAPSFAALVEEGRRGGLLLVDEAHRAETERVRDVVPLLEPSAVVGLSATPYLTDRARTLSLFDESLDGCTLVRALDDGILVPWEFRRWDGPTLAAGGTEAIDAACAEMIARHAVGPGLVTAASIRDAEAYAARLTAWDCPAEPISSADSGREQARKIEALRSGALQALVQVRLLAEGVDLPWLRWVCLREEIGSAVDFVQVVGRVLRTHPGKDRALVLDPHLLGLRIGLHHDARVGLAELDAALQRAAERTEPAGPPPEVVIPPPIALGETSTWLAACLDAYRGAAIPIPSGDAWVPGHPTPRAIAALRRRWEKHWKNLPAALKPAFEALAKAAEHLTASDVAMATTILAANADYVQHLRTADGGFRWSFKFPTCLLSALPAGMPEPVVRALAAMGSEARTATEGAWDPRWEAA